MADVKFKTKGGKKVAFKTGRKGRRRKVTARNRFMAKRLKHYHGKGVSPTSAMRKASADWRKR